MKGIAYLLFAIGIGISIASTNLSAAAWAFCALVWFHLFNQAKERYEIDEKYIEYLTEIPERRETLE